MEADLFKKKKILKDEWEKKFIFEKWNEVLLFVVWSRKSNCCAIHNNLSQFLTSCFFLPQIAIKFGSLKSFFLRGKKMVDWISRTFLKFISVEHFKDAFFLQLHCLFIISTLTILYLTFQSIIIQLKMQAKDKF